MNITGHVVLEDRKAGRVWVAKYMRGEGTPTRKVLGPAWAKPARGQARRGDPAAKRWRTADGPKPDGYLTPREADAVLGALLAAERAKPAPARRPVGHTFGQACGGYLTHLEREGIAPSTLRRYRGIAAQLTAKFGEDTPLRRVNDRARIDAYREELVSGELSRSSARQVMVVLGGILKRAQRRGWVAHNAAADVDRVKVSANAGSFNVLDPAQVEAVARAAEGNWEQVEPGERKRTRIPAERAAIFSRQRQEDAALYAAVIRVAAYTGLRLGELRALRWGDVDFERAVVRVQRNAPVSAPAGSKEKAPKSSRVRSVPLTPMAATPLDAQSRRELYTGPDDYVFPSPTGARIDGGKLRDAFYGALDKAGLGNLRAKDPDPITFHDLRHTFGTLAVRVFPITDVQAMMGHADITTTMRYVHYAPRHDAAERLAQAFAVDATAAAVEAVGASPAADAT
jgi:integrase